MPMVEFIESFYSILYCHFFACSYMIGSQAGHDMDERRQKRGKSAEPSENDLKSSRIDVYTFNVERYNVG